MAKKRKSVAKQVVRGLKEFSKKLKSGKPIKATRMRRVKIYGTFWKDGGGLINVQGSSVVYAKGSPFVCRPVTITWTEPVTI